MMTYRELWNQIEIFFNHHPVFCMVLFVVIIVTVYDVYMETFQHDEMLRQTMDVCVSAQSFQKQTSNLTAHDVCKAWVYQK